MVDCDLRLVEKWLNCVCWIIFDLIQKQPDFCGFVLNFSYLRLRYFCLYLPQCWYRLRGIHCHATEKYSVVVLNQFHLIPTTFDKSARSHGWTLFNISQHCWRLLDNVKLTFAIFLGGIISSMTQSTPIRIELNAFSWWMRVWMKWKSSKLQLSENNSKWPKFLNVQLSPCLSNCISIVSFFFCFQNRIDWIEMSERGKMDWNKMAFCSIMRLMNLDRDRIFDEMLINKWYGVYIQKNVDIRGRFRILSWPSW